MTRPRVVAVVVDATSAERVGEALRAAVGLTLRGDRLVVAVLERSSEVVDADPQAAARALATLEQLGHQVVRPVSPADAARIVRGADAVEVWT